MGPLVEMQRASIHLNEKMREELKESLFKSAQFKDINSSVGDHDRSLMTFGEGMSSVKMDYKKSVKKEEEEEKKEYNS
jgi:hypothetical protein